MIKKFHNDKNGFAWAPFAAKLLIVVIVGLVATTAFSVYRASEKADQTVIYEGQVTDSNPFGSGEGILGDIDTTQIVILFIGIFLIYMVTRKR